MSYGFNNPYFRYDNNYSYSENNPDYDNYNQEDYNSYNNQDGIFIDENPPPPNYEFKTMINENKINKPLQHSIYPYHSYKANNENYTVPSISPIEINYKKDHFKGPHRQSPYIKSPFNPYLFNQTNQCSSCPPYNVTPSPYNAKQLSPYNAKQLSPHYAGYVTTDRTNNANIFLSTGWDERPEDFNPGIQWLGNPNGFSNPNILINPNLLLNPSPLINPFPLTAETLNMNTTNHPIAQPLNSPNICSSLNSPNMQNINFLKSSQYTDPNFILKILLIIILIILFAMLIAAICKKNRENNKKNKQNYNYLFYL